MSEDFQQFQKIYDQVRRELKTKHYIQSQMASEITTKERIQNAKKYWRLLTYLKYMKIGAMQGLSDFKKSLSASNLVCSDLAAFFIVYGVEIISADVTLNLTQELIFQITNGFDFEQNFKSKLYEQIEQVNGGKPLLLQISDAVKQKVLKDIQTLIEYTSSKN